MTDLLSPDAGTLKTPPEFSQSLLDEVDLPAHLIANAAPGVCLSDRRIADYSLLALSHTKIVSSGYAEGYYDTDRGCVFPAQLHDGNFYKIYINGRRAIALAYKGIPNAVASLSVSGSNAMVSQIQGVRGYADIDGLKRRSSRGLAPLRWSGLMVDICEETARTLGAEQMMIDSGRTAAANHLNGRLALDRAVQIYDAVAKAKGYRRNQSGNYWLKEF